MPAFSQDFYSVQFRLLYVAVAFLFVVCFVAYWIFLYVSSLNVYYIWIGWILHASVGCIAVSSFSVLIQNACHDCMPSSLLFWHLIFFSHLFFVFIVDVVVIYFFFFTSLSWPTHTIQIIFWFWFFMFSILILILYRYIFTFLLPFIYYYHFLDFSLLVSMCVLLVIAFLF